MNLLRRLALLYGLCAAFAWSSEGGAFPIAGKPIRLVVPFPAGSEAFDGTARILAERLAEALNTPVVIENRPGGGTIIGNQTVAAAPPDGHTLLYAVWTAFTMLPHQLAKRPYDEFRDFTPITTVARSPLILLATASLPAMNIRELVAYARARPGALVYGSWQFGGLNHLYMEMLKLQSGVDMVHVPYKSPADSTKDLLEGRIHLMMGGAQLHLAFAQAGKLRALGATGKHRAPGWRDVPTFAEQGFEGFEHDGGIAIFGPANMEPRVVQRLNQAIGKILRSPETVELMTRAVPSLEIEPSTPQALGTFVRRQHDEMGLVIRRLGIRID